MLTIIFLVFTASGCSSSVYVQADQQYLLTSIAFCKEKGETKVFAEAVVVNTESTKQGVLRKIVSAKGKTVRESVLNLSNLLSKPMLFDHLGMIIFDSALDKKTVQEILDYAQENEKINLAAYIATSDYPIKLLNLKPVSTLSVGYDLMGVIDRVEAVNGISFHNRFYEIKASALREDKLFLLPSFSIKDDSYELKGGAVFANYKKITQYDIYNTAMYSILTDSLKEGSFGEYKIKACSLKREYSINENSLFINMRIKAKILKGSKEKLEREAINFLERNPNPQIFGFKEDIYKRDRKIWEKTKQKQGEFFNNIKITLNLEEI